MWWGMQHIFFSIYSFLYIFSNSLFPYKYRVTQSILSTKGIDTYWWVRVGGREKGEKGEGEKGERTRNMKKEMNKD